MSDSITLQRGRRSRLRGMLVLLVALGALLSVSAGAAYAVLPGSNFQGDDGNQADQAPFIDWQSLQAVGRVVTTNDPNAEDSAFTGGDKEETPIDWEFTTEAGGVNPPKSNIFTSWLATDQTATSSFLYLAFVREEAEGNTFLTFELNQVRSTWVNAEGETIPCRTTGDLLISYNVGGGLDVDFTLYSWVGDPGSGPASCPTGGSGTFIEIDPGANAEGAMNVDDDITNFLPTTAPFGGEFPQGTFGEGALNITAILSAAGLDPCVGFAQAQVHTRSSQEINSQLQDLVGPVPFSFQTCTAGGTKFHDRNSNGTRDPNEPGLAGWTIYVDYNDNGVRDPGEPFAVSDGAGNFTITGVDPGTFTVREVPQPGWTCTAPAPNCTFTRTFTGGNTTGLIFGNVQPSSPPPPPPPPPSPPPGQPQQQQPPPTQVVVAEQVVPGTARLLGPRRCVPETFSARVTGRAIERVVFSIDGKRVATVTRPDALGRFLIRVDPTRYRRGERRLRAQVFFTAASRTAPRTFSFTFRRCARAAARPRFTG